MDQLLAKSRHPFVTATGRKATLAKRFLGRQLRTGESYGAKWQYVVGNPVRHRLAKDATQWPYQGEVNLLRWHDK